MATKSRIRLTKWLLLGLMVANIIDTILTMYVIQEGLGTEFNPLMEVLIDYSLIGFAIVKILIVSLCILLLWRFRDRKLAYAGTMLTIIVYYFVLVWHLINLNSIYHNIW